MNLKDYTQAALKTESVIDEVATNKARLLSTIELMIGAGNMLDDLKKNIFYGKPINDEKYEAQFLSVKAATLALSEMGDNQNSFTDDNVEIDPRVAHGIIGIATESTELLEALYAYINSGELDKVNVAEEVGDSNWYEAILLDALGKDWETMLQVNIEKLEARYQGSFSTDKAINRDLDTERDILEQ